MNITSINGLRGKFGQCNYAASKAGLIGLTKSLARELARFDVTVNAVAPGLIDTPATASLPAEVREQAPARNPARPHRASGGCRGTGLVSLW